MKTILNTIRTIITFICLGLYTVFFSMVVIVISFFQEYSAFSYEKIARNWARMQLWLAGIQVEVEGLENMEPGKSYIVVCNHQSYADIPVMIAHIPQRMTILAKKELFSVPFFGPGIRAIGILSIDRQNREKAFRTLQEAARVIRERRISVLAFPEGTRSEDGRLQEFKQGPFMLAIDASIPILPVTIDGTFAIFPKGRLIFTPGKVRVRVYPAVVTDGYKRENRKELIDSIHQTMSAGLYEAVE